MRTQTMHHAPSAAASMQAAIEQGLGAHRTKLGPGDKEEGYLMRANRAKAFVGGIVVTLVVLVVLAGSYAALFNDERMRRMFQLRQQMVQTGNQKEDLVRLGLALHQQESERESQERDTVRTLKRITSVVERKFDHLLSDAAIASDVKAALVNAKRDVTSYVADELRDFERERSEYDREAQKRLQRLAKMQEQSMRELLKTVAGVKMEALMDMLEEVFQAAAKAPALQADVMVVERLQEVADGLYEERITLEEGRQMFDKEKASIHGDIPADVRDRMARATDPDEFADALDSITDIMRLAAGRADVAAIERQWRQSLARAQDTAQRFNERAQALLESGRSPDEEGAEYDDEVRANVDAVLAVHKLVSEGKVPLHLLDFEAMELFDSDNDGVPDEEEGQEREEEGQEREEGHAQGRREQQEEGQEEEGQQEAQGEESQDGDAGEGEGEAQAGGGEEQDGEGAPEDETRDQAAEPA